ncbi:MAG: hypothetical protein BGO43_01975 [Gammaproteobacteria bacterium 39-13]|nr:hypothetical protein [Gammaproteobacteria bacterium]OJV91849.1 MAG: hypothetical protein BGO43_01975 [Gammaproteobacteria bacterium 39-13]
MASLIFSIRTNQMQAQTQRILDEAEKRLTGTNVDDLVKRAQTAGQKVPDRIFAQKGEHTQKITNIIDQADHLQQRSQGLRNS